MNEDNVLDTPEKDEVALSITLKSVLLTALVFVVLYPLFFFTESYLGLASFDFSFWKFKLDLSKLIFVFINCAGLYIFISFIRFELKHWFRIMTVSILIVLIAVIVGVFFIISTDGTFELFIHSADWKSVLYRMLKSISFISVIIGGGSSLAVQFLHKKNYLIFSAIMICTLAIFSLIEYL